MVACVQVFDWRCLHSGVQEQLFDNSSCEAHGMVNILDYNVLEMGQVHQRETPGPPAGLVCLAES